MITDPLFYAFAVPAVFLMGIGKGGFSGVALLAVPLMAFVVPPLQAAAIALPILMAQDVVSVWAFRREFSARNLKLLLPGGLLGLFFGYLLAREVSGAAILLILGVTATLFVAQRAFRGRGETAATQPAALPAALWGSFSGFTSFIAHAGFPPLQVYLMPQKLAPSVYAGTATIYFAILNYIKFPIYLHLGQINTENLATSAVLAPLAVASTAAGVWLVRRVPIGPFYAIVYALTLVLGLKLMWDGARGLGLF